MEISLSASSRPLFPDWIRIWSIVFVEGRKPEKILHVKPTQGIKPRPHWWEANTFTTVLSQLPIVYNVSLKWSLKFILPSVFFLLL